MKMTLLEMVQNILSDMNSDEVNSISDTTEALQVASVIRDTYYELASNRVWPTNKQLITLTALANTTRRTHVRIPDNVAEVKDIRYNCKKSTDTGDKWKEITYLAPDDFLDLCLARDISKDNVEYSTDISGRTLYILNDAAPTYWTTFDDEYIIFDSYDSDVDSTIQQSKIIAQGDLTPEFRMEDNYVPDLPTKAFPFFLSEAKSVSFNTIKQAPNAKEEQRSRRQRIWLAREKWRTKTRDEGTRPNYGRK